MELKFGTGVNSQALISNSSQKLRYKYVLKEKKAILYEKLKFLPKRSLTKVLPWQYPRLLLTKKYSNDALYNYTKSQKVSLVYWKPFWHRREKTCKGGGAQCPIKICIIVSREYDFFSPYRRSMYLLCFVSVLSSILPISQMVPSITYAISFSSSRTTMSWGLFAPSSGHVLSKCWTSQKLFALDFSTAADGGGCQYPPPPSLNRVKSGFHINHLAVNLL